jgi:WD40 repeat protein
MRARTLPDASVQLRIAGRPPLLLGTAATFARDLGLPQKTPLTLTPYPSPSGSTVAVMVAPITGRGGGVVILSRAGRLITTISRSAEFIGALSWSPSGTTFAFNEKTSRGQDGLGFWSMGGRLTIRTIPHGAYYGPAVWSPDGKWVLVAASRSQNPNAAFTHWVIMPAAGGPIVSLTGPGTPISWIG